MCAVHSDAEGDVRDMFGFKAREDYGSLPAMENEIGKVEDVRYVESQIIEPWADAGGTAGGAVLSTLGTSADVYPALYFARDAYAITALKGQFAITPMVVNRKPSDSDPWAQRTHVTWKTMQGAIILNDEWMGRSEIAVSA
jgi:N4-gp56 family major capsid protein